MTLLDVLILLLLVSAAIGGYQLGLIARLGSWIGMLVGLFVGIRFGPEVADALSDGAGTTVRLTLSLLAVLGPGLVGQAIGFRIGVGLRRWVPRGPARTVDRIGGAAAGCIGLLVIVWLLLPVLGGVPAFAPLLRSSSIIAFVDEVAPPAPARLRDLRSFVARSPFPEVFTGMGRAPQASAPPDQLPLSPADVERIAASTVNVEAIGCGRTQEGSGFVVGDGLIATNAHVVAGTDDIEVLFPNGRRVRSTLVAYDDDRDIAILAGDFRAAPLPLAPSEPGADVAIFGHPAGQDQLRVTPGAISEEITATGRDIYGRDRVRRQVYVVGARLQQGDSGAALVDGAGQVVGQAFAIAPDRPTTAYALTDAEVRAVVGAAAPQPVGSGPCQAR